MKKETGCIHIYCGDGKGKTTCGMGLCVRAAGYGYKVLIYQFMKDNNTSERSALEREKEERRAYYENQFLTVTRQAETEGYDVLFLDEIIYTIRAGLFDEKLLLHFLDTKPESLEVILSGQDPSRDLIERADYVSEIRKLKHPFDQGMSARNGIER